MSECAMGWTVAMGSSDELHSGGQGTSGEWSTLSAKGTSGEQSTHGAKESAGGE